MENSDGDDQMSKADIENEDGEIVRIPYKRWYQWLCFHWWDYGYELSHPLWEGSARVCRICKKAQKLMKKWETINVVL